MSTRAALLILAVVIVAAVSSQASSTLGGSRPDAPYAVILDSDGESAPVATAAESQAATAAVTRREEGFEGMASVLMLVGFLGLIGVNLVRWSGDASCKSERSVF